MGIIKDCPRDSTEKCTDKYGCRGACAAVEQFEKEWRAEQEPVAWMDEKGILWNSVSNPDNYTALYTAPPKKEWQGLTEGETIDLALSAFALPEVSSETREKIHRDLVIAMNDQDSRLMLFAANIEAKLKEKNT